MDDPDRIKLSQWIEKHVALLAPPGDWEPNMVAARARLETRLQKRSGLSRSWRIGAVAACLVGTALLASPVVRDLAHRLWQWVAVSPTDMPSDSPAAAATMFSSIVPPALRHAAPDFTLDDSKGNPIRLSDYRGRVVLLNFWATWCPPCEFEIPWFMEFGNKYKARGLAVIGLATDEEDGWTSVRRFIAEKKVDYPIGVGDENLGKLYGVVSFPMTLLIDRNGRIAGSYVDLVNKSTYESEIRILLQESPGSGTR